MYRKFSQLIEIFIIVLVFTFGIHEYSYSSSFVDKASNNLEALKLISDWAKWLVTIETGAIAIIGTLFKSNKNQFSIWTKSFGSLAIICFLLSIAAAGLLLLTLPEIAQNLQPGQNIWRTRDYVAYGLVALDTEAFAIIESVFFGLGLTSVVAMIISIIWL